MVSKLRYDVEERLKLHGERLSSLSSSGSERGGVAAVVAIKRLQAAGQCTALLTFDLQARRAGVAIASAAAPAAHSIFHAKRGCCAATTCCTDTHTPTHTVIYIYGT